MGIKITNSTPNNVEPQSNVATKNEQAPKSLLDTTANERGSAQSILSKRNDGDSLAAFNKQKMQLNFAAQQSNFAQTANKEINGVSENSVFPKTINAEESQENVLRRTFEEYAFKAGISNVRVGSAEQSPAESFVAERMAANKDENNGEYKIFNSATHQPYSTDEWKEFQKSGGIVMKPTTEDVESLKTFKGVSNTQDGALAAEEVMRAMNEGFGILNYRPLASDSVPPRLAKALEMVRAMENNDDFQSGFVNKLGADKFLQLENTLQNNPTDNKTLTRALSKAIADDGDVIRDQSIGQQIAQKADVGTLARLTGDQFAPQGTDFLVEAGKRVTTPQIGWKIIAVRGSREESIRHEAVSSGTNEVLAAISRSPTASAALLQNADFVKNGLRMSNMADKNAGESFAQILRAGTSPAARQNDAKSVEKAIMTVSQTLRDREYLLPDGTINQNQELLGLNGNRVNATIANAMADVYQDNIEVFSSAASLPSNKPDSFNGENVRDFIGAIQPYYSVKDAQTGVSIADRVAAATAVRYMGLLSQAESTGKSSFADEAANLAGTFINGNARANIEGAKEKDARQEKLAKAISIVGEVTTFYLAKGINEIAADLAGKALAGTAEIGGKGNNTDNAVEENQSALNDQQTTNMTALVQVYEQAAYDKSNGKRPATTDDQNKAKEFLSDLKTYNDSLRADEKILDRNGRLINPAQMTGDQTRSVTALFGVGSNDAARGRLNDRMGATRDKLRISTQEQIK